MALAIYENPSKVGNLGNLKVQKETCNKNVSIMMETSASFRLHDACTTPSFLFT
jgi:hypothetical protein